MKKVLLIVIDALAANVVQPAVEAGKLPNVARLIERGRIAWECTSIFPSITPAATASIATGCYPREHGVSGAYFYDRDEDRVHYYGDDFWVLMTEGMGRFFEDFLVELNLRRLSAPTIYEHVERAGLSAGCLNFMIFRGETRHDVHVPLSLKILPGVPFSEQIFGPETLLLGDFAADAPLLTEGKLHIKGGMFHRFGFNDDNTGGLLVQMAEHKALPDLTVAYFPDNDFKSHKMGPEDAEPALENFDRHMGKLADVFGGVDALLEQFAIVITGDHSQSDTYRDDQDAAIDLDQVLESFEIVDAGEEWSSDDELMVCPNLRVAQIYLRRNYWTRRGEVIEALLRDERVDQVIWQGDQSEKAAQRYHVATRDRGKLEFWPGDDGPQSAADVYGMPWIWSGDLRSVDGRMSPAGVIEFADYPNAFERIATSFDPQVSGDLWVTARLGYEFEVPRTSINSDGGSHASLAKLDSTTVLLVAGGPEELQLPTHARTVDVLPVCLALLGLPVARQAGASHVGEGTGDERRGIRDEG